MKQGRFVIILILVASVLIFSSCSRSVEFSIDADENELEETSEPSDTQSQESSSPGESEESNLASPENSGETEQPTPTPKADTEGASSGNIKPIQMSEAGMEPIPISNLNGVTVNPRIQKLAVEPWDWQINDYTLGIDQYNNVFVINSRFSEGIAGLARMGLDFDDIIDELGSPGYKQDDLLVYRTSDFYLAFYGAGKAELAAFIDAPVKDYVDDFLYALIAELNSDAFTSLETSINKLDPGMDFFHEKGSNDGSSYYAHSIYGIDVSNEEEPIIDIMNNYEGNLYIQDSGNIRFSQVFNNLDTIALILRETLYRFHDINSLIEKQGIPSPDGRLKAIYYKDNSFIVRTLDGSIQDRYIYQSSIGDFFWLSSRHLLYIDDFMYHPEFVDIDVSMPWGESILEKAGLDASGSYKIVKVEGQIITLEDTSSGVTLDIKYEINSIGEISFSVK